MLQTRELCKSASRKRQLGNAVASVLLEMCYQDGRDEVKGQGGKEQFMRLLEKFVCRSLMRDHQLSVGVHNNLTSRTSQ